MAWVVQAALVQCTTFRSVPTARYTTMGRLSVPMAMDAAVPPMPLTSSRTVTKGEAWHGAAG